MKQRLILVFNRLSYTLTERKWKIYFSTSAGGLVSSIKSFIEKTNVGKSPGEKELPLWVGSCDLSEKNCGNTLIRKRWCTRSLKYRPSFCTRGPRICTITGSATVPSGRCSITFPLSPASGTNITSITPSRILPSAKRSSSCTNREISCGRKRETMEEWFGTVSINLAAKHGAFFKRAGNDWTTFVNAGTDWKSSVMPVMNIFTQRCAGTFIEEKKFHSPGITAMPKKSWLSSVRANCLIRSWNFPHTSTSMWWKETK